MIRSGHSTVEPFFKLVMSKLLTEVRVCIGRRIYIVQEPNKLLTFDHIVSIKC